MSRSADSQLSISLSLSGVFVRLSRRMRGSNNLLRLNTIKFIHTPDTVVHSHFLFIKATAPHSLFKHYPDRKRDVAFHSQSAPVTLEHGRIDLMSSSSRHLERWLGEVCKSQNGNCCAYMSQTDRRHTSSQATPSPSALLPKASSPPRIEVN